MASINEISYRILNIIRPKLSDDDAVDITEIKFDVNNVRTTLLKQKFDKKYFEISSNLTRPIQNLEVEPLNTSTILSPEIASNTIILRSKLQIPKVLTSGMGKPLIKQISPANITGVNFTVINGKHAQHSGSGKFNKRNVFAFIEDDYVYFISKRYLYKSLTYVNIDFVPEDAQEYKDFMNDNYSAGLTDNDEYPVTLDLIKQIEDIIIYNKLLTENNASIDSQNDGSDSLKEVKLDDRQIQKNYWEI